MEVTSGVPKGWVFGPTLVLAYFNDLPGGISYVSMFADDAQLMAILGNAKDCKIWQWDLDAVVS